MKQVNKNCIIDKDGNCIANHTPSVATGNKKFIDIEYLISKAEKNKYGMWEIYLTDEELGLNPKEQGERR
jgi:hypothetical protein